RPSSPQIVQGSVPGKGDGAANAIVAFNPVTHNQRSALSFSDGVIYVAWASFCDTRPYHGWVISYDAQSLAPIGIFNTSPDGGMSGIWMSGAGPVFDRDGNLFAATGNGTWDGAANFGE